jgi:hypothetical protein
LYNFQLMNLFGWGLRFAVMPHPTTANLPFYPIQRRKENP